MNERTYVLETFFFTTLRMALYLCFLSRINARRYDMWDGGSLISFRGTSSKFTH